MSDFTEQTASLRLPSGDHARAFTRFALEVLSLERKHWPLPATDWHSAIEKAVSGEVEPLFVQALQREIRSYRNERLKEPEFLVPHSSAAALTNLFELAAIPPLTPGATETDPALARAIDEFADEFIEHFGRWEDVLVALKKNFRVEA